VLEKASENEIAGFQSFTVRNLDNKLPAESDIEQYKVLSVKEDPLDNRQQHLDVMCYPGETEVRVNNYNPLLLMLWQANIDIQFVAESSLALVHYVSGYVTKAERSNMQEIWQVSENKSVYSRLWSFGV